ncbi:MAG: hypothetical protein QG635_2197, partial [Bacteroidota bacterium]|nr:hypothetical protein [Bacteroidota bacterium]
TRQRLKNSKSDFFIENKGQWPPQVRYLARKNGLAAWVTDSGVVYDYHKIVSDTSESEKPAGSKQNHISRMGKAGLPDDNSKIAGHVIRMTFVGSLPPDKSKLPSNKTAEPDSASQLLFAPFDDTKRKAEYDGINKQEGYFNYFIGNDSTKWASFVGLYKEVFVRDLYKGIDIRYYYDISDDGRINLRYDFIVHPGADLSQIKIKFDGADDIRVNEQGELVLNTSLGEIRQGKLFTYQVDHIDLYLLGGKEGGGGKRLESNKMEQVQCLFVKNPDGTIGFEAEQYDKKKVLIID